MFLIDIKKLGEADDYVDYSFSASEATSAGVLRLQKATGKVSLVRPISGGQIGDSSMGVWRDPESYFSRASRKVVEAWKRGDLPQTLTWAS